MSSTFLLFLWLFCIYFQQLTSIIIYCRLSVFTPHYKRTRIARNRAAVLNHYAHPRTVRDVCPLADYRAPDRGLPHATAFGDKADFTCGMTAKEDKTAPCRVGRAAPGATDSQTASSYAWQGVFVDCLQHSQCWCKRKNAKTLKIMHFLPFFSALK